MVRALGIDDGVDLRRAILLDTLEAIRRVRLADRILLLTPRRQHSARFVQDHTLEARAVLRCGQLNARTAQDGQR